MLYATLTLNLIIFGGVSLLLNVVSLVPLVRQKKGKTIWDNPGLLPLFCLLFVDCGLSLVLIAPIYSFVTEKPVFSHVSCQLYGVSDMWLSLFQILLSCFIAFDRYISTVTPKWRKWKCHTNYTKLTVFLLLITVLWSTVPIFGYGRFDVFLENHFCSLDWKQGDIDHDSSKTSLEYSHRYVAFLTATCLVFFLIPVCISSSFYYSIIDHVDRQNSSDAREEGAIQQPTCDWAPKAHVAKVGLGCLLSSTLPYLAYSIICLNPMKSDFSNPSYLLIPVIMSRVSCILNPLLYIWCNPGLVPIDSWLEKKLRKRRPPPKQYHTLNLMMNVPGMSFPLLTPTVPRRQLPQIPPHLVSPSKRPSRPNLFKEEQQPMLGSQVQ